MRHVWSEPAIRNAETTFSASDLSDKVDLRALAKMRYAGDYFLWSTFCKHTDLRVIQAVLGGFRTHAGQLSENFPAYRDELFSFCRRPDALDFTVMAWDALFWFAPTGMKKLLNPNGIIRYDKVAQRWL